mmetsp:Transcript_1495/g.4126  ORF Transcript_1495/g.4126 Transcript_1495/m.4126 type:complete len:368 (+) Transcript_1495:3-1106(+)
MDRLNKALDVTQNMLEATTLERDQISGRVAHLEALLGDAQNKLVKIELCATEAAAQATERQLKIKELDVQLAEVVGNTARLEARCVESEKETVVMAEKLAVSESDMDALRVMNDAASRQATVSNELVAHLEGQLKNALAERDQATSQVSHLENELIRLQGVSDNNEQQSKTERERLESVLKDEQQMRDDAQEQLAAAKIEVQQFHGKCLRLAEETEELERSSRRGAQAMRELASAKQTISNLESELMRTRRELDGATGELTKAESYSRQLKGQVEAVRQEKELAESRANKSVGQLEEMTLFVRKFKERADNKLRALKEQSAAKSRDAETADKARHEVLRNLEFFESCPEALQLVTILIGGAADQHAQ